MELAQPGTVLEYISQESGTSKENEFNTSTGASGSGGVVLGGLKEISWLKDRLGEEDEDHLRHLLSKIEDSCGW